MMHSDSHNARRTAFTLVEALLATLIGTLLIVLSLSVYQTIERQQRKVKYYAEMMSQARYVLNRLGRDITNLPPDRIDRPPALQILGDGIGRPLSIRLNRLLPSPSGRTQATELSIHYDVEFSDDRLTSSLTRRTLRNESQGEKNILAQTILSAELACYDDRGRAVQPNNSDTRPRFARLRLVLADSGGDLPAVTVQRSYTLRNFGLSDAPIRVPTGHSGGTDQ